MSKKLLEFLDLNRIPYEVINGGDVMLNAKSLRNKKMAQEIAAIASDCDFTGAIDPETFKMFIIIKFDKPKP